MIKVTEYDLVTVTFRITGEIKLASIDFFHSVKWSFDRQHARAGLKMHDAEQQG